MPSTTLLFLATILVGVQGYCPKNDLETVEKYYSTNGRPPSDILTKTGGILTFVTLPGFISTLNFTKAGGIKCGQIIVSADGYNAAAMLQFNNMDGPVLQPFTVTTYENGVFKLQIDAIELGINVYFLNLGNYILTYYECNDLDDHPGYAGLAGYNLKGKAIENDVIQAEIKEGYGIISDLGLGVLNEVRTECDGCFSSITNPN